MSIHIKRLVSKKKRRFVEHGYDLDLTYIDYNIIAMGFPAKQLEGIYRNNKSDVVRLLETKHKDSYKVYNLCSERDYNANTFRGEVVKYPFDDHNPPKFEQIKSFCKNVEEWLDASKTNIAAVHCKAGKGRTGVMICCYLVHSKKFKTSAEALDFYAEQRTKNGRGVTIPSQRRYIGYYSDMVRFKAEYKPVILRLHTVELDTLNLETGVTLTVCQQDGKIPNQVDLLQSNEGQLVFDANQPLELSGDIKIMVTTKNVMRQKVKVFHFWFNTFFLDYANRNPVQASQSTEIACFTSNENELDVYMDRIQCAHYPADKNSVMIATFNKDDLDGCKRADAEKYLSPLFSVKLVLSIPDKSTISTLARSS